MGFLRTHIWGLLILVAIVASFVVSREDSISRDRAQHTQLVQGCERGSYQKAMGARGWFEGAKTRRGTGDFEAANRYEAVALGMIHTIPAPKAHVDDPRLADATLVKKPGERPIYVLTSDAQKWQREGCQLAFP